MCPVAWHTNCSAAHPAIRPAIWQTPDRTAGQTADEIPRQIASPATLSTVYYMLSTTASPAISLTATH